MAADKAAKGCASRYSGAEQHSASLPECQVRGAPEGGEGLYTQGRGWTTWRIQAAHHTVKVVNTQLREAGDITVAKLGEVDQVIADGVCARRGLAYSSDLQEQYVVERQDTGAHAGAHRGADG